MGAGQVPPAGISRPPTTPHKRSSIQPTGTSRCYLNLAAGDLVSVFTADHRRATIIIDHIDPATHKVAFSIEREHDDQPILPKVELFAYRWRGPRGGGHSPSMQQVP